MQIIIQNSVSDLDNATNDMRVQALLPMGD